MQGSMRIRYEPRDESRNFVHTNIGEFNCGDERTLISEDEISVAQQLVANGDFVDVGAGKTTKVRKALRKPRTSPEI